jgi:hypothetical protein
MKSYLNPLTALLALLGIEDLVMVPFMLGAHSQPPMAATVASGVLGAGTLASIPGLMQGRRWAFWTTLACRIVDALSGALGAAGGPEPGFKIAAAVALVLSVAAIVLVIRFSRRRAVAAANPA